MTLKVSLIYFTGKGRVDERIFAARLLAFTKGTRLKLTPNAFEDFMNQKTSIEGLYAELDYMSSTVPSSWEFVDLVFSLNNISRVCAQQITRTRTASYAMQSQRVVNVKDTTCHIPASVPPEALTHYQLALSSSLASYEKLVSKGCNLEDARGVLPMNVHCNLLAKYNFRAWIDLVRTRSSKRIQDEYIEIVKQMKEEVLKVWPWADLFLKPKNEKAVEIIEREAAKLPEPQKFILFKASDLIKKESA